MWREGAGRVEGLGEELRGAAGSHADKGLYFQIRSGTVFLWHRSPMT